MGLAREASPDTAASVCPPAVMQHDTPVPGTQYLCSDPAALGGAAVQRRPLRWLEPSVGGQRARRFGGQTQVNEQLQVGTAALQQSLHSALCSIPAPEQYDSLSGLGDHYGGSGGTAGQFYMDQIPAQGAAHINGGARSQHKGRQSDAQTDLFVQRCSCKSQKQQADDGPIARIKIELCPWPSGDHRAQVLSRTVSAPAPKEQL